MQLVHLLFLLGGCIFFIILKMQPKDFIARIWLVFVNDEANKDCTCTALYKKNY